MLFSIIVCWGSHLTLPPKRRMEKHARPGLRSELGSLGSGSDS